MAFRSVVENLDENVFGQTLTNGGEFHRSDTVRRIDGQRFHFLRTGRDLLVQQRAIDRSNKQLGLVLRASSETPCTTYRSNRLRCNARRDRRRCNIERRSVIEG